MVKALPACFELFLYFLLEEKIHLGNPSLFGCIIDSVVSLSCLTNAHMTRLKDHSL